MSLRDRSPKPVFESDLFFDFEEKFYSYLNSHSICYQDIASPKQVGILRGAIKKCVRCTAIRGATAPVPPILNPQNRILVIARNPGRQEDKHQVPLYRNAPGGSYFNKYYLKPLGLSRNQVSISNTIHCYTKNDRRPLKSEVEHCAMWKPFELNLHDNLEVIFTLGNMATRLVMGWIFPSITRIVGNIYELRYNGKVVKIIPLCHPGYFTRGNHKERQQMIEFLQTVRKKFLT